MPTVASYHRVSTIDQNATGARTELRAAASRMGSLVLEVEEKGSGARNDRPGLKRILEGARRGLFDTLLVWKLDRLGRSVLDVLANVRNLTDRGVTVIVTSQNIVARPGGDALSSMVLTMLAAVAEFERDLIRDRTRLAMDRVKRDGTRSGRPVGRPRRGAVPTADAVQRARDGGMTWRSLAAHLGCTVSAARRVAGVLDG